jgi:nucleotide-binding universal stress UspA family protein
MKTILVPTDYSEVANNATRYAIELSKELNAKLVLFHAYHRPVLLSSLPLMFADKELEKFNADRLKAEEYNIKNECCRQVETETIVYNGRNVIDGIKELINEKKIDYIVMGITGANTLAGVLIGSNAISVIKNTKVPVFIIPKEAQFKKIERFVFVHDYDEDTPENVTEEIKMFCEKFKSELIIYGKPQLENVESFYERKSMLESEFEKAGASKVNHVLRFSEEEDQTEEINSFVEFNNADMIAMTPSSSKSFASIFRADNTTLMAFHTHLPLLILHGKE